LITGIYSFRLVFMVFFGEQSRAVEKGLGWSMTLPLVLIAVLALFGGLLQIPLDTVFPDLFNPEYHPTLILVITIAAPFLGLLIAALFYLTGTFSAQHLVNYGWVKPIRQFFLGGWGLDALYDNLLVCPFKTIAKLNKNDAVDGLYLGLAWLSRRLHRIISATQAGRVRWYASSLVFGAVAIIAIGLLS
jgi:NADH-quinone oxidoreductase subunit L